jgi:5-methyltetrahydropteroyltriglutamate--homocysteine methyltransferase
MQLASKLDRRRVLQIVCENLHPPRRVLVGVIDPVNPKVETPHSRLEQGLCIIIISRD